MPLNLSTVVHSAVEHNNSGYVALMLMRRAFAWVV